MFHPSRDPDRTASGRGLRGALVLSVFIAAVFTLAFDQYRLAEHRHAFAGDWGEPDRASLAPPDLESWLAAPLIAGHPAPDFNLVDVRAGARASLSDDRGRPVVLLLGSFGCNAFCSQMSDLIALSRTYEDRVAFLFVVIRDAGHPEAGSPAHSRRLGPDASPEKKLQLICEGLAHYGIPFTTLIDSGGAVERAYSAFPKRLVVVDPDGVIAYDGGRGAGGGPSDWDLAAVRAHLDSLLGFTR